MALLQERYARTFNDVTPNRRIHALIASEVRMFLALRAFVKPTR
jgi:hypothetical protein